MLYDSRNDEVIKTKSEEMWSENYSVKERRVALGFEDAKKVNVEDDDWALEEAYGKVVDYLVAQVFATIAECNFFSKFGDMAFAEFLGKIQSKEVKDIVVERLQERKAQLVPPSNLSPEEQQAHRSYMDYIFAKMKVYGLRRELKSAEETLQCMKAEIIRKYPSLRLFMLDETN